MAKMKSKRAHRARCACETQRSTAEIARNQLDSLEGLLIDLADRAPEDRWSMGAPCIDVPQELSEQLSTFVKYNVQSRRWYRAAIGRHPRLDAALRQLGESMRAHMSGGRSQLNIPHVLHAASWQRVIEDAERTLAELRSASHAGLEHFE